MADELTLPPPADLPRPRWEDLDARKHWVMEYDKALDTLYLHPGKPKPGLGVGNRGIWIQVHPTTGEIVGLQIEDFQKVFLAQHPDFANAWKQMKSKATPQAQKETWLEVLVKFIRGLMDGNGHPQQPRLLVR